MLNELEIEKIKNSKENVILTVKVISNAKKNSIEFLPDNIVKLRISQVAVDGKANKEIISFLSDIFNISKSKIKIIKGEKASHKNILLEKK